MRWAWWCGGTVGLAAAGALWPLPPASVERWYGLVAFPPLQRAATSLSNLLPVAMFDILVVGAAALVIAAYVTVFRAPKGGRARLAARRTCEGVGMAAGVYLAFLLAWGLNYQRPPMAERVDFSRDRVTDDAVRELNRRAAREIGQLRPRLPERLADWPDVRGTARALEPLLGPASAALGLPTGVVPGRPKRTLLDPYFTRAGISGMTDPFFLETLLAGNLLAFETPQVIAHEWGHLAGLARESDASFFAWTVCVNGTPEARYSAWIETFVLTLGAFDGNDRRRQVDALPAAARADLRAAAERSRRDEMAPLRLFAWRTYDTYLKANRVQSGVRNYGEVVQLLVGTRFDASGRPVRRSAAAY